jgi:hypothetical protein
LTRAADSFTPSDFNRIGCPADLPPPRFQQIRHGRRPLPRTISGQALISHCENESDGRLIGAAGVAIPVTAASHVVLAERMEGVRDAHKTRRCDCNTCILE